MNIKEFRELYLKNGYRQFPAVIPSSEIFLKDRGEYTSCVIIIDNDTNDIECLENIKTYRRETAAIVEQHVLNRVQYLMVLLTSKMAKKYTKAENCCVYVKTDQIACNKKLSKELLEDYDILKRYCVERVSYYKKKTAFLDSDKSYEPIATYLLAFVLIGCYLFYVLRNINVLGDIGLLGISVETVFVDKEYYRLLTYMFAHSGVFHMVYNVLALLSFGKVLEERIGFVKMLLLFVYGGVVAGAVSCFIKAYMGNTQMTAGASGAIYTIAGATFVYMAYFAVKYGESLLQVIIYEIILIGSGFLMKGVDNYAHLGGYGAGVVIGGIYIVWEKIRQCIQYIRAHKTLEKNHRK